MAFYQLKKEQLVNQPVEKVWEFISNPSNLQRITPPEMGFEISSKVATGPMYPGMMISYRVSPLKGIRMTWVSEITQVKPLHYFIDEQRIGPYAIWHHEHILEKHEVGTKMIDIVSYSPPLGFLGKFANALFIEKKLEEIFSYRFKKIDEIFHL